MNSTSRSSRLVSSAARSPALAITGPEVARKFTPSSRETICASVVLPRPGRADEQHMVERLLARARRLDEHREVGARLLLPDEFGEPLRAQRGFRGSSSRRSGVTRRRGGVLTSMPRRYLFGSNSPMVDDRRAAVARHDDARLGVVIVDQLAAGAAGRHDRDLAACLAGLWMAHRHDRLDPVIALLGERAPDRDRLGADRACVPHRHRD